MNFTHAAEDMHAIAADLNEIYDAEREQAWAEQEQSAMGWYREDCDLWGDS